MKSFEDQIDNIEQAIHIIKCLCSCTDERTKIIEQLEREIERLYSTQNKSGESK